MEIETNDPAIAEKVRAIRDTYEAEMLSAAELPYSKRIVAINNALKKKAEALNAVFINFGLE